MTQAPGVPSVVVGLVQERERFGLIKCNALATRNPSPTADTVEAGELMAARIIKMLESRAGTSPNLIKVSLISLLFPSLALSKIGERTKKYRSSILFPHLSVAKQDTIRKVVSERED